MCLITEQRIPFIAEEDMIVYKVLTSDLQSAFYRNLVEVDSTIYGVYYSSVSRFQYELGKLYETEILESRGSSCYDGIDTDALYQNYGSSWLRKVGDELISYGQGFHFAFEKDRLTELEDYNVIVECTLPKGTEYFENVSGLGVANQIIINKVIPT